MVVFMKIRISLLLFFLSTILYANNNIVPDERIVYKKTLKGELRLHVFYPENSSVINNRTVVVHFFGGGWKSGSARQFYQQCKFLVSKGYVAISADYRTMNSDSVTPFDCVEDARDAIIYIRSNYKKFGINPQRIFASGGSAGGHIALCTAVFDSSGEEMISSKPNALILYNPVLDTTKDGYGMKCFDGNELSLSPNHNITSGLPPTLIMHGTADKTVPYKNALTFKTLMDKYGNDCKLVPFKGADHGFFNGSFFRKNNGDKNFYCCMKEVILFLKNTFK